ncbi:MAG: transglycosylase family protein [Thermoleophilaceae bacterium]
MSTNQADLSSPIPWRRSLRRSRERRLEAARRRRWRLRGRSVSIMLVVAMTAGGGAALASGGSSSDQGASVAALQRALGVPADGVYGPQTKRAVMAFQRSHGLVVDGVVGVQTLRALGLDGSGLDSSDQAAAPSSTLERIAQCESGGDPTAVSPTGLYRGKYQFSRATWRSLGGSGDPARAPESEQDRMAALLLQRSGTSAWPVCGRGG